MKSVYDGYWRMTDEPSQAMCDEYERLKAEAYADRMRNDPVFAAEQRANKVARDAYFAPMRLRLDALTSTGRTRRKEVNAIRSEYPWID